MNSWFDRFEKAMFDLPIPAFIAANLFVLFAMTAVPSLFVTLFPKTAFVLLLLGVVGVASYGAISLTKALRVTFKDGPRS